MNLGFDVPSAYIVPVERFCREMGPALGINLAEFEFPAYFNYFIRLKRCTLVVDSLDAENNIRRVFGETLLGPAQFRDHDNPKPNEDEDFDPGYPEAARPNFYKESFHFRTAEKSTNYQELTIDTLLAFCHFKGSQQGRGAPTPHEKLGVPPTQGSTTIHSEQRDDSLRRHTVFNTDVEEKPTNGESLGESTKFLSVLEDTECSNSTDDTDDDSGEKPGLRRTMSDPDVRKATLEDLMPVPPSPGIEVSDRTTTDALGSARRPPRRGSMGSMDSSGSFMTGVRSRDGMSWASGASFMLASDDEEDPSRNSWMYSQAKWLGKISGYSSCNMLVSHASCR